MTQDQIIIVTIIVVTMIMFVWGRYRYDLVAVTALMACVLTGVVPAQNAFEGFGHAAVITVAAVLIMSQALQNSGVVDVLVRLLAPTRGSTTSQIAAGGGLAALLSSVMNNVGALALMLPVMLRNAIEAGRSPSLVLIPLSFASLLGGLVTMIGTPPNIVIASYREQVTGEAFGMFDFAPVGLILSVVGLVYLSLIGWRLLAARVDAHDEIDNMFHAGSYSFESVIPDGSPFIGLRIRDLEARFNQEVAVLALIRGGTKRLAPRAIERFRAGDALILQGDPLVIQPSADGKQLGALGHQVEDSAEVGSEDVAIVEAVLMPNSIIEGRSMRSVRLHDRYGINLLAVGRQGRPATARLKNTTFKTGDILLLQGETQEMEQALRALGCLVLADRGLQPRRSARGPLLPLAIFAVAIIATAIGLTSAPISFTCAVIALIVSSTITLDEAYGSIEWPVILLLGSLIPLGEALQHSGTTDLVAGLLIDLAGGASPWVVVMLVMVVSMWLSDLIHNTPTAVLMAPIAVSIANGLGANADGLLMAVAVGAASPYLTPIGHQSNTLVMSPGGYTFFDFARVGAPMQLLIVLFGVPAIMLVWPQQY